MNLRFLFVVLLGYPLTILAQLVVNNEIVYEGSRVHSDRIAGREASEFGMAAIDIYLPTMNSLCLCGAGKNGRLAVAIVKFENDSNISVSAYDTTLIGTAIDLLHLPQRDQVVLLLTERSPYSQCERALQVAVYDTRLNLEMAFTQVVDTCLGFAFQNNASLGIERSTEEGLRTFSVVWRTGTSWYRSVYDEIPYSRKYKMRERTEVTSLWNQLFRCE